MNRETLLSFRYCFQRVLVPCAVFIGVLGNSVSVLVLTRKRMRSSTNIYLTALAIADIIYLMMVFALSFQHYKNIHHPRYELYWRTYGLQCWFCDAAAYTSIYITVSFTVERYIAVCHPIRGQVLCTESKAKKVISVVFIACLLCTCTTPFEYLLNYTPQYVDMKTYEQCIPSQLANSTTGLPIPRRNCTLPWATPEKLSSNSTMNATVTMNATQQAAIRTSSVGDTTPTRSSTQSPDTISALSNESSLSLTISDALYSASTPLPSSVTLQYSYYQESGDDYNDDYMSDAGVQEDYNRAVPGLEDENIANMLPISSTTTGKLELSGEILNSSTATIGTSTPVPPLETCQCFYYLEAKSSPLGENETYLKVFMWTTSVVFTFIPLMLLLTFNTFLVLAVRESNRIRDKMTNMNSRKMKSKISSISQENKITVTLIAVVILFIICQTPTAIYIIINASIPPSDLPEETRNVHLAMGNIFNFLITFNAASNFFLYCALSEKYRQTVKDLVMGRRHHIRQATLKSFYLSRQGTISESLYSKNRFGSEHKKLPGSALPPPPPPLPPVPLPSIADTDERSNPVTRNSSVRSQTSLGGRRPSYGGGGGRRKSSLHNQPIPEHYQVAHPQGAGFVDRKHSGSSAEFNNFDVNNRQRLKPSISSSSLTRSQSVVLEPKVRHSPNCKKFNDL